MYGRARNKKRFTDPLAKRLAVFLVAFGLLTPIFLTTATTADAQDVVEQQLWGKNSDTAWKRLTDGTEQGTQWRQLAFDDSSWDDVTLRDYHTHGTVPNDGRGYYYRTEFELTDIWQIEALRAELYYDDAAVMFLNGQEVYRTIRNNLPTDPELSITQTIPFGGAEDYYVKIPASSNRCEAGCVDRGATDPIDVDLLIEGTNVIGIMAWTTAASDLGVDLALSAVRDLNATPPGPEIDPVPDQNSELAEAIDLQVTAESPAPPISWSATDLPDGLQINANTGRITGSPTSIGDWESNVTSLDANGETFVTFAWSVVNAAPEIDNPGALQSPVLAPVSVQIDAVDPDGGTISYGVSGLPEGLSMNAAGLITGTPTVEDAYTVTVTATDDEDESTEVSFAWQIAEPAIDIDNPGAQQTPYGESVSLPLSAVDPAGGAVTFSVEGLPPGLTYRASQTRIAGRPTELGEWQVVVTGQGPSGGAVISFTWEVLNVEPTVAPVTSRLSVTRIGISPFTVSANDPDGGSPQVATTGLPPGISFDPDTLQFSGTPTTGGDYTVTVTATDDENTTGTTTFSWGVEGFENPIRINEVVASNTDSLEDEDGNSPDWIELHNPTSLPISLTGWSLEDASTQWMFPNVLMQPGSYLIVFASDKDRAVAGSELHANFKLSKEGDSLTIVDGNGFVIDRIGEGENGLPRQLVDVSYGLDANGQEGYLSSTTPRAANSGLGADFAPVLRPFTDRLYNIGEPVSEQIDGFDPDGDALSFGMSPAPSGVTLGLRTGELGGQTRRAGTTTSTLSIVDADSRRVEQQATWYVLAAPTGQSALVLNEYNAVSPTSELFGGFDPAFGDGVLGNGGDWFEFVVVQDRLDIRGWTIELWDRDNGAELLKNSASLTFTDAPELSALPSGTIITISEDLVDDIGLDPNANDWHINLQSNDEGDGAFITAESQENFNSSRSNQNVIIRNFAGQNVSPVVGETETWDYLVGGVGAGEVMSLCINPALVHVDPVNDYLDNGFSSSFGQPNTCTLPGADAAIADDDIIFVQNLNGLRSAAQPLSENQLMTPEVTIAVSCLAGNGRVDTTIVNPGDSDAVYRVEFEGLSPRQWTVAPGDWWRSPLTGRRDADYRHVVKSDGVVISDRTVTVACDTAPPQLATPEVQVINACRADRGYLLFQFVNNSPAAKPYVIEFEGVPNRSTSASAYGQAIRAVTGRQNGSYLVRLRSTDGEFAMFTVTVDC